MVRLHKLHSLEGPQLQPYRTMRRQMEHRKEGIFVAEGEKVVRRLLESKFQVASALMPEKWFEELKSLVEAREEIVDVFIADKALLETLTGFSMYQGLLAVGKVPAQPSLAQILKRAPSPYLLAAVDGLSSAENLGSVVRNCAAFNVQALLIGETCTSPFLRRAVRSSMGAIFELPIIETNSLTGSLEFLKAHGLRCIAAHPHAEKSALSQTNLTGHSCLVFGSEGYGLSAKVLETCDEAAAVPMPDTVDSLNVGSAAAVFLYEANRQRGKA